MISSWTRRRAGLVVAASAAAVLTATSMAGAHQGDDDENVVHGCVNDGTGALRVVSATDPDCRPNETPLHWTIGDGSTAELDAFKAQLAASGGTGSLVDWSHLAGVPGWIAGGVDYSELTGTPVFPAGSVDGSTVVDGSLTTFDVRDASLVSDDILDGTVQTRDLAAGAVTEGQIAEGTVTGEKIFDGTVRTRDLADGAVTPDKVTANVQAAQEATAVPLDVERLLPSAPVPVSAPASASIMVTGQVQISCSNCQANPSVWYQLERTDGTLVAGPYRLQLSPGHGADVASISALDFSAAAGGYAYRIRMSATPSTGDVQASNLFLVAHVLGT